MQLMPATGRMLGRQQGMHAVPTSLLLNPGVSIRLGTEYLRQQLNSWDGDWFRTLAAYNAGPGRVRAMADVEQLPGARRVCRKHSV